MNNTGRQVGSVLGVALLVSVIGNATDPAGLLHGHQRAWLLVAIAAATASIISLRQPNAGRRSVATVTAQRNVERDVELDVETEVAAQL